MKISLSMLRQIIREEIEGQMSLNEMGRERNIKPGDELFDFINTTRGSTEGAPYKINMIDLPDVLARGASTKPAAPLRKDFIWTRTGETVRALSQGIAREIFKIRVKERSGAEVEIPLEEIKSLE